MLPTRHIAGARLSAGLTIGSDTFAVISAWADAAGLSVPLAHFTAALGVRTDTQRALFAGTMSALEGLAPILRRWDLNGSQTYGLARLAAAWRERPAALHQFKARTQHRATPSADFFRQDLKEGLLHHKQDALYFLFEESYPYGADDAPQRCLRSWTLIHAMRIAALDGTPDQMVSEVAQGLAKATRGTEASRWCSLLAAFGASADTWEDVNDRFDPDSSSHVETRQGQLHSKFRSAAKNLAKGKHEPFGGPASQCIPGQFAWHSGQPSEAALDAGLEDDVMEVARTPVLLLEQGALSTSANHSDDENEIVVIDADPDATPAEQSLRLQSLQLRLGAAARFLPWGTWDSLTPPEAQALPQLIAETLESPPDADERLLAAMVQIALDTAQTLDKVAITPLDALSPDATWRIDLDAGRFVRKPPRHATHWQRPSNSGCEYTAAAHTLSWPIKATVLETLRAANAQRPAARFLGQLRKSSTISLRRQFRAWVRSRDATKRIEGSFLASLLGQQIYLQTGDAVLARLMGTSERQALPASTVYTAFHGTGLNDAIPGLIAAPARGEQPINVAGSLLDPIDLDLFNCAFAEASLRMGLARQGHDWIDFHNSVALHWDAALRAATGVRPVDDLWKSVHDFNWDGAQVFVDDKASPYGDTGRLIPLPRSLCARFKADYVERHLPWVLQQLTHGDGTPHVLPGLLFVIQRDGDTWRLENVQNRHRRLDRERIYEGTFPQNVFRHRLRTRLHQTDNLDLEIVDTVLGHRDGATLTHGTFTMRVWHQDAEAIRPALTAIFEEFHFEPPPLWHADLPMSSAVATLPWPDPLARADTAQTRAARRQEASRDALIQIREYIAAEHRSQRIDDPQCLSLDTADASLETAIQGDLCRLSEEQVEELSALLLRGGSDLPSSTGAIKYQALLDLAAGAMVHLGKRVRIRKRYAVPAEESSPFAAGSARARAVVTALQRGLDELFGTVPNVEKSRLPLHKALGLAIYDLLLRGRIVNTHLLRDVIADDAHWRVIRLRENAYLEWSPSEDLRARPTAPVLRYAISMRAAWLLTKLVFGRARRLTAWSEAASWTSALHSAIQSALSTTAQHSNLDLLEQVSRWVSLDNAIELPGTVAAYLDGRLLSPSLPWGDWIRLQGGGWTVPTVTSAEQALNAHAALPRKQLGDLPEDAEDEFELDPQTLFEAPKDLGASRNTHAPRLSRQDSAQQLFKKVRAHLTQLTQGASGAATRERVAQQLAQTVDACSPDVSSGVQLLARWAIDLLLRRGRPRKLASSSVLRYFGALSPSFQLMGYDTELHLMEEDELEAFYAGVLATATVDKPKDLRDGLRNFHLFAMTAASLPPVDWSGLAVDDTVNLGSPGWVDDNTYLELLQRLGDDKDFAGAESWQLQCIAVLARRFGLRAAEATGLRGSDLQCAANTCQVESVIVRNTRERRLKTSASRRVVPLVYGLHDVEQRALQRILDARDVSAGDLDNVPLFAVEANPTDSIDGLRARARINDHMKALTGQSASSLHKLRKAFLVDLWTAIEAPGSTLPALATSDGKVGARITETLLGQKSGSPTRRGMWAVCRAAGHAQPKTTLRSYVHVLSDITDLLVRPGTLSNTWQLRAADIPVSSIEALRATYAAQAPPARRTGDDATPFGALKALLHLAHGRSVAEVEERTDLPFETVEHLRRVSDLLHDKLCNAEDGRLKRTAEPRKSKRMAGSGLLRLVHANAHARLRTGLAALSPSYVLKLRALPPIEPPDFAALVGDRRQISMWEPAHFDLVAIAARVLVTASRIRLEMPALTDEAVAQHVQDMARRSGWQLASATGADSSQTDVLAPLVRAIGVSSRLPRLRLQHRGLTIDARAVMRLTGRYETDKACDSIEFVIGLLCLAVCARRT